MLGGGMRWGRHRSLCPIDMTTMVGLQERWRDLGKLVVAKIETENDKQQECGLQGKEHLPTHGVWLQPSGRTREGMTVEGRSGAADGHKYAPSRTKNIKREGTTPKMKSSPENAEKDKTNTETTIIQGLRLWNCATTSKRAIASRSPVRLVRHP